MISVVIPLYNKENQITHTLQSVLSQTFQKFEIVIVDDGSTDNSIAEVQKICDDRIRLFHQKNAGVSVARNRGIQESKYELIAFLDADDEWKPDYLQTQYELYQKYPECSVYACDYEFRDRNGKITPTIINKLPFNGDDGVLTNYFEVAGCSNPPLWTSAVVVQKNAIQAIGGFPAGIKSGEDLLTWARLALKNEIAYSRQRYATFVIDPIAYNTDQNNRMPEKEDFVGNQLRELYYNNKSILGLRGYVALWHKMRARIFLDKNLRFNALRECVIAMKYRMTFKIMIFIIMTIMPHFISKKMFNLFQS
jgi:glycosyltransferase involved in cell wall biosynthesis